MGKPRRSLNSSNQSNGPRIERKIIEKIRRTKMKDLYCRVASLLPQDKSKVEGVALPDQIDEVIEHITHTKMRIERLRQKREYFLLQRNRASNFSCITNDQNEAMNERSSSSPLVEVHDMGPNVDVVLANALQNYSIFRHIIRLVHQNGVEIASASFVRDGNSCIHVLHDKVGQAKPGLDGATISRKVKELVHGGGASNSEVVESQQLSLWDYEFDSNFNWGFEIPEVLLPGLQEFFIMKKS